MTANLIKLMLCIMFCPETEGRNGRKSLSSKFNYEIISTECLTLSRYICLKENVWSSKLVLSLRCFIWENFSEIVYTNNLASKAFFTDYFFRAKDVILFPFSP